MNLFVKAKSLPKLSMLTIVLFALFFSACEKEPSPSTITEIKVCNQALIDDALCESNLSTFDVNEPRIYVSAIFSNIDRDRLVRFTLFGQDLDGNWINILETSSRPSDQGNFDDDETNFRMNVHFTKNSSVEWVRTVYMVEAEIDADDGDDGATDSIEFEII